MLYSIIFGLFAIIAISNSTYFINKSITNQSGNRTITVDCHPYELLVLIVSIEDLCSKIYIPYLLMVGLNVKVILVVRKSKKNAIGSRLKMNRFTFSTILIDLIFLIFKMPDAFVQMFLFVNRILKRIVFNDLFLVSDIFSSISFSYSVMLIFIFLIFNRLFRQELVAFFRLSIFINRWRI